MSKEEILLNQLLDSWNKYDVNEGKAGFRKQILQTIKHLKNPQPKQYVIINEKGDEYYKDENNNIIILNNYDVACCTIGIMEVDGYVCEIKYHHVEDRSEYMFNILNK
jgi:hypothetical protein